MGSASLNVVLSNPPIKEIRKLSCEMSIRIFSDVSNIPTRALEGKRVTRASRKVLGEIKGKNAPRAAVGSKGKSNVVGNLRLGQKRAIRETQTKLGVQRTVVKVVTKDEGQQEEGVPMEVDVVRRIPDGVPDIDVEDASNPQLCTEYAQEIYAYLRQLEKRGAVRSDFLSGCPITEKMRAVLVDWLVEVQMQFKLLQETLFLTVNTIDRFLAVEGKNVFKSRLQLVGVAAMFLVSKIEEVYAPAVSDFVYITDNAYSGAEIRNMELQIIRALDFDLCQPLSLNFLRRYSKAGDVDMLQHSLAKYTLEVCLLDYHLLSTPGSLLASAALCLSLLVLDPSMNLETVWNKTLAFYSGYTSQQVLDLVPKLATNMTQMNLSAKLQAVRNKYMGGKFMKVAGIAEARRERMLQLASCK